MNDGSRPIRGRGASDNPANRFDPIEYEPDPEYGDAEADRPATQYFRDTTRSIITYNDSPDVGFDAGINPYRGCEHGCIYCYARPTHEYLGFSGGLDFETRILVKENAADLLRSELSTRRWKPQPIGLSGGTDPYQPIERRLELTRSCLGVLRDCRNPVVIITKNHLVTRDIDLLSELAEFDAAAVMLSITTLDPELARTMEPRTSSPARRLAAIEALAAAGVPVGVLVAPVIPGLNDHEIPRIIRSAADAGGQKAGYIMVRLPHGVGTLFEKWLEDRYPDHKDKVMNRIRSVRGGRINDPNFTTRQRGQGPLAQGIADMVDLARRGAGMEHNRGFNLSTSAFRRPPEEQIDMFE